MTPPTGSRILMALVVVASCCEPAAAQPPGSIGRPTTPMTRPTTSPYLNLLRDGGRNATFNYFRLVRPELEFRRANAQQFQSIERLQRRVDEHEAQLQSPRSLLGPTGHATSFLNHGSYFRVGGGRAGAAGFGRRGR